MVPITDVLGGSFEGFERWILVKNEERLKLGIEKWYQPSKKKWFFFSFNPKRVLVLMLWCLGFTFFLDGPVLTYLWKKCRLQR